MILDISIKVRKVRPEVGFQPTIFGLVLRSFFIFFKQLNNGTNIKENFAFVHENLYTSKICFRAKIEGKITNTERIDVIIDNPEMNLGTLHLGTAFFNFAKKI